MSLLVVCFFGTLRNENRLADVTETKMLRLVVFEVEDEKIKIGTNFSCFYVKSHYDVVI